MSLQKKTEAASLKRQILKESCPQNLITSVVGSLEVRITGLKKGKMMHSKENDYV